MTLLFFLKPHRRRRGYEEHFPRYVWKEKKKERRIKRTIRVFRAKLPTLSDDIISKATLDARAVLDDVLTENPLIDLDAWLKQYLEQLALGRIETDEEDLMVLLAMIDEDMRR